MNDSLGDRMKLYERASKSTLPPRMPVILRVDGRAFSKYTTGCKKPFDSNLMNLMDSTAIKLCEEIQGAQLAYVQSDEISILLNNYKRFNSQSWFDNGIQKMTSVSAAIAAAHFTANSDSIWNGDIKPANFDSRAFILPEKEVRNYFLWRQQDTIRNSVQMLARSLFSHKECNNKNCDELKEMCFLQKEADWNYLPNHMKFGRLILKTSYSIDINNITCLRTKWDTYDITPDFKSDEFKEIIYGAIVQEEE